LIQSAPTAPPNLLFSGYVKAFQNGISALENSAKEGDYIRKKPRPVRAGLSDTFILTYTY
jgi:hypothetical protein